MITLKEKKLKDSSSELISNLILQILNYELNYCEHPYSNAH